MLRAVAVAVALVSLAALACTDLGGLAPIARVAIAPDSLVAVRGDTVAFTATVFDARGRPVAGATIVWSSSDTSIVAVGTAGIGRARASGTAWVRATAGAIRDSAPVRVVNPVTNIVIDSLFADQMTLRPGGTEQLRALVYDSAGQPVTVTVAWSSDDSTVAAVDNKGGVRAHVQGRTWIHATFRAAHDSILAIVFSRVASIAVPPDTFVTVPGARLIGFPVVKDSAGDVLANHTVQWTSTDAAVVTVDSEGGITARATGTASVIGAADGVTDTAVVHVRTVQFTSVSTGGFWGGASCGLTTDSLAFCWGSPVGTGSGEPVVALATGPLALAGGLHFKQIVAAQGPSGCGLAGDGTAYCWGFDGGGRLGIQPSPAPTAYVPTAVTTTQKFDAISMSFYFVCAVTHAGDTYCWGAGILTPYHVAGVPPLVAISAGAMHGCGIAADSTAYCWHAGGGCQVTGDLGTGDTLCHYLTDSVLSPVAGAQKWISIAAGLFSTCGVAAGGAAYCWGESFPGYSSLGTDSVSTALAPVPVRGGLAFDNVAGGHSWLNYEHFCGVEQGGAAACWSSGVNGALGNGADTTAVLPVAVLGGYAFSALSVDDRNTCGLTTGGVAYCWGDNSGGQLGDGTFTNRFTPVRVVGQP